MENLFIVYNEIYTDNEFSSERYGSWYSNKEVTLKYATTKRPAEDSMFMNYEAVTWIDKEDPENGDTIIVVYAIYESGDSFGRSEGNLELIVATKSMEVANKWKKAVEESEFTGEIKIEHDGKTITLDTPWNGYFERFTYADVEILPLFDN